MRPAWDEASQFRPLANNTAISLPPPPGSNAPVPTADNSAATPPKSPAPVAEDKDKPTDAIEELKKATDVKSDVAKSEDDDVQLCIDINDAEDNDVQFLYPDDGDNGDSNATGTSLFTKLKASHFSKNIIKIACQEGKYKNEFKKLLIAIAQEAPPLPPPPAPEAPPIEDKPKAVATPKEGPVKEKDGLTKDDVSPDMPDDRFDAVMEQALKNITIEDVISKLEKLSKVHRVREVPRQLAMVDFMLQALGLSALFPQLSEATKSALESNNYISTRLDQILANLKGAAGGNDMDLEGNEVDAKPEVAGIKDKLEKQRDTEEQRKKSRKEQENQKLDQNAGDKPDEDVEIEETPEPEITEAPGKAVPPQAE